MDFITTAKRVSADPATNGFSSRLTMYNRPPEGEVALEEFERFALARLRVLKGIEEHRSRAKGAKDLGSVINELSQKHLQGTSREDTARRDVISHYVLRLAYCRTEELRRWFLTQESTLFRHRFQNERPEVQTAFFQDNELSYELMGKKEFEALKEDLLCVARSTTASGQGDITVSHQMYFRVPFEHVPELVGSRRVLLRQGVAFVPRDQMASIVVGHFRAHLSKALVLTCRKWTAQIAPKEADRLTPLVESLSSHYLGDYTPGGKAGIVAGSVRLGDLDTLARSSFPLCMRSSFLKLREEHHLKHGGRMQLGLFLKGIGLSLDDALEFWRAEFTHRMPADKWQKEHSYTIRHNYGKEGKRTDYTPYSCMKVIQTTPGLHDACGCPYRRYDEDSLRAALRSLQIAPRALDEIVDKAKGQHYQVACSLAFAAVHGSASEPGINHPNQYFEESQNLLAAASGTTRDKGGEAAAGAAGATQDSGPSASASAGAGASVASSGNSSGDAPDGRGAL